MSTSPRKQQQQQALLQKRMSSRKSVLPTAAAVEGDAALLWAAADMSDDGEVGGHDGAGLADQDGETAAAAVGGYAACGGVLAFALHGGLKAAEAFFGALRVASVAPSLGGVETLVVLPAATSHAALTPDARAALGISDGLVRVACGIEAPQDLVRDFLQAADVAAKAVA
jgi:O-acetylhomoserine/O-acetylserine sulfhydrylase-like pyridoxal-dependent enzyme